MLKYELSDFSLFPRTKKKRGINIRIKDKNIVLVWVIKITNKLNQLEVKISDLNRNFISKYEIMKPAKPFLA